MADIALLKPKLTRLKLSGMMDSLQLRFDEAVEEKWSFSDFLERLLQDEVERRDSKQLARRLVRSGLSAEKTLETFDFSFNPKIHEPSIREIALCNFMKDKENVFFVGPSGVGKSHLAQAIGHEAVRRGYEVLFRRTVPLFRWVAAGHADGSRLRRLKIVTTVPLLILDDFGLQPLSEEEQNDLYEVLCERYERASTIITSNRDFGEWPTVFSNPLMSSAAMDRLVHHAVKFVIEGKSYRVESFAARQRSLTTER
ncbi:MAG: Chromosomal replication initiator protein DnaA [Bacteroidetes bacterium ADurb.BinA012]|jgi:DNA replication protein DnaC|nr:MAG: Chromosomal replication initiator protein DnaA [Bacteroidetes bacterium ADurb.BinA012]